MSEWVRHCSPCRASLVTYYYLWSWEGKGSTFSERFLLLASKDLRFEIDSSFPLVIASHPLPILPPFHHRHHLLLFLLSSGCQPGWENGLAVLRDLRQPGRLCSAMKGQDFCLQLGPWWGGEHSWQPHSEANINLPLSSQPSFTDQLYWKLAAPAWVSLTSHPQPWPRSNWVNLGFVPF